MTDLAKKATEAILAVFQHNDQLQARIKDLEALQGDQELWCVIIKQTGETLAMKSKDAAEKHAGDLNGLGLEGVTAEVIASPWPQDIHTAKSFRIMEAWLDAANHALQVKTAEILTMRGLLCACAALPGGIGNPD